MDRHILVRIIASVLEARETPRRFAFVHIGLGQNDRAFEGLQKAVDARDWQMALLKVEPGFDSIRPDTRFAALVERVGLPQ